MAAAVVAVGVGQQRCSTKSNLKQPRWWLWRTRRRGEQLEVAGSGLGGSSGSHSGDSKLMRDSHGRDQQCREQQLGDAAGGGGSQSEAGSGGAAGLAGDGAR